MKIIYQWAATMAVCMGISILGFGHWIPAVILVGVVAMVTCPLIVDYNG